MNIRGFTTIELLITISVAAILMLIAVPDMHAFVMENRAAAEVNNLVTALQFTRNAAISQDGVVKFCESSDQRTCGGAWRDGQLTVDSQGQILRLFPALPKGDKLIWNSNLGDDNYVGFSGLGATTGQWGSFYYCPQGKKHHAEAVIISKTGHIKVEKHLTNSDNVPCDN
ncbi:MAG: GspH/FimT family pseudopilin [Gammaproteobacteria bacterium]|nr:GspH/FimT family pseudopilin [Gammaproteobacteria bacterium]